VATQLAGSFSELQTACPVFPPRKCRTLKKPAWLVQVSFSSSALLFWTVQQQQVVLRMSATKAGAFAAREGFGRASGFSHCWGAQHQEFSQHITWECWIVFLDWDQICSNHTPADPVACLIVWLMCPASISIYNTVYILHGIYIMLYVYADILPRISLSLSRYIHLYISLWNRWDASCFSI